MVGNLIFGANRWRRSVSAMLKQMLQQRTGPHLEPPLLVFGGPYSNLRAVLVGRFLRVDVTAPTNLFVKAHSISICGRYSAAGPLRHARGEVGQDRAAGTIDIGPSVKHGLDVQLPRELLRIAAKVLATGASTFGLTEIDATTALVVWLHRIEIERRLSAEIDAACGDDGLDDAERERQTREVSAALF